MKTQDPRDKIRNPKCKLCSLHQDAEHVCLMGDGSIPCRIMIVGEAPGRREDEQHRAFVGAAGKFLDEVLEEAGLSRAEVYITNAARCRPPDNRTPTRAEVKICVENYFWEEVEAVSPDYMLLLGNSALRGVLKKSGITKHRGILSEVQGIEVLPTYHPAAILRNPYMDSEFRADVHRFARMVRGEDKEPKTRTIYVGNKKSLQWLRRQLMSADHIAFDVETTGLDEWRPDSAVVSISFTWQEGLSATMLVDHSETPWRDPVRALRYLKPALERSDCKYIAHNAKFDAKWLASYAQIFVPITFDTMIAAHMLDENRGKGLKMLSQVILGAPSYDIGDDVKDAYNVPRKRLLRYNAKDTDYTLRLYNKFKPQLKEEQRTARIFAHLVMPVSEVLTKVEQRGIYVPEEPLKRHTQEALDIQNRIRRVLLRYLPDDKRPNIIDGTTQLMNFNSPPQVAEWLFEDLGLPIIEETPKGAPSTKESVLLQLAKQHKAPRAMLKWRKWDKYLSTYLLPWLYEDRDERSRIHPTYRAGGTRTGRLSSANPNLQQVPRNPFIRNLIQAPPGYVFVEADYSQIELRIAAMVANEKRMLRAFAVGEDIHMTVACQMTGKTPDQVTSEERKKAKAVNFGFLYGMGAKKFVNYAFEEYDLEVTLNEAIKVRSDFFALWPRLQPWHDRQRRVVKRFGYVQSPIGRVRHLPDIESSDKGVRAEAERQAINSPVQGMASDLMLMSLIELDRDLPSRAGRIVGTVHDSVLLEVRESAVDEVLPLVKQTMENPPVKKLFKAELTVPIQADISVGSCWGDLDKEEWNG